MEQTDFEHNVPSLRQRLTRQANAYLADLDEAEDVVQETLLKLWQLRERIPDAERMEHLALVVVRNACISVLRRTNRRVCIAINEEVAPGTMSTNAHERMEQDEAELWLRQCIHSLPDKQRAILKMRNVEGLSYGDIAKIIGTTESSVRGLICRARNTLLKQLKDLNK